MLYRAINQDGGYSARRLTRIDEPPVTQWAMATRLLIKSGPCRRYAPEFQHTLNLLQTTSPCR
jgi:hypothetical protein